MKKRLFVLFTVVAISIWIAAIVMDIAKKKSVEVGLPALSTGEKIAGSVERNAVSPEDLIRLKSRMQARGISKKDTDCKSCHSCEYPTERDACLVMCPRSETSIHHSPEEAPEIIVLDDLSKRFGNVVFSHKLHAQMSMMSMGCTGCHHYNTTGPVLSCKKCHEKSRKRENISAPDLEAAYHRQCMPCHRQWDKSTNCNSCHLPYGLKGVEKQAEVIKRTAGRSHPVLKKPDKIVFETTYNKGRFVMFNHDEHINLFRQPCLNCHKDDNCVSCHDAKKVAANNLNQERHFKVHKTFDEHHKVCSACHENEKCTKCHDDKVFPSALPGKKNKKS